MKRVPSEYTQLKKIISSYITKYPVPTQEENRIRLEQIHVLKKDLGDPSIRRVHDRIRDYVVLSNGGFGMKYILKYINLLNDDAAISEMFQEVMLALLETVDNFDITRDISFTTYAYFHVRKRIIDFIKKNKLVKAPRDIARNIKHVNNSSDRLYGNCGHEPTVKEITRDIKQNTNMIIRDDIVSDIISLINLNCGRNNEPFITPFHDQLIQENQVDEDSIFKRMKGDVKKEISTRSLTEQHIIKLRFGIDYDSCYSLEEIKLILGKEYKEIEE
jgi:RNA polymerase sigma factor (sigma-70 family)